MQYAFTFHYGKIKTFQVSCIFIYIFLFTFHYGKIKTGTLQTPLFF